jgi:hypothetical protein
MDGWIVRVEDGCPSISWDMAGSWMLKIELTMDNCTIDCIQVVGNFSREATCVFVEASCPQDTV